MIAKTMDGALCISHKQLQAKIQANILQMSQDYIKYIYCCRYVYVFMCAYFPAHCRVREKAVERKREREIRFSADIAECFSVLKGHFYIFPDELLYI